MIVANLDVMMAKKFFSNRIIGTVRYEYGKCFKF